MAAKPQFGELTIIEAAQQVASHHASFDHLIFEWGLDGFHGSLQVKGTSLGKFALKHPEHQTRDGRNLSDAIVYEAIIPIVERISRWNSDRELYGAIDEEGPDFRGNENKLLRLLERDGFIFTESGELRRTLPEIVDLPAADDEVHGLLNRFGFVTPKGHLDQAIAAHTRGDWAAANGQMRPFVEGLCDAIAEIVDPENGPSTATGHPRRQLLAKAGFLSTDLNEWSDDGKGFLNQFYRRLHPHGSHPGLSEQEDSTFRLHLVLLIARHLLRRLVRSQQP